jgi:hypothetical protein
MGGAAVANYVAVDPGTVMAGLGLPDPDTIVAAIGDVIVDDIELLSIERMQRGVCDRVQPAARDASAAFRQLKPVAGAVDDIAIDDLQSRDRAHLEDTAGISEAAPRAVEDEPAEGHLFGAFPGEKRATAATDEPRLARNAHKPGARSGGQARRRVVPRRHEDRSAGPARFIDRPLEPDDLPYAYDALAALHVGRDARISPRQASQAYVNQRQQAARGQRNWEGKSLEEVVKGSFGKNQGLFNNAGQHYNHLHFWNWMKPNGGGNKIPGALRKDRSRTSAASTR